MNLARSPKSLGCGLRKTDIPNLPFLDQPGHRTDGILNWRGGVDTMLVVEVDSIDSQPLETGLTGLSHIFGLAADAASCRIGSTDNAKLRGDYDSVTMTPKRASDQLLVGIRTICVGSVKEIDSQIQCAMKCRD